MGKCAKCGRCCEVIAVNGTKRQYKESNVSSAAFMLTHWHRVSRSEAVATNWRIVRSDKKRAKYYYKCDQYDPDTKSCLCQEEKPPVCRDFPWYGTEPTVFALCSWPECSFWEDVPNGPEKEFWENMPTRYTEADIPEGPGKEALRKIWKEHPNE